MKRIFMIGWLVMCLAPFSAIRGNGTDKENAVRDSIIRMLDAMPPDTLRFKETCLQFQRYIQSDWSLELADRAIADARALNQKDKVLLAVHNRYRYAQYRLNLELVWKTLEDLKKVCFEYKEYVGYFRSSRSALALCAANGNFEEALHRAEILEQEAKAVNYRMGVVYVMMGKADIYRFMEDYEKSRRIYIEVLKHEGLTDSDLLTIQGTLSSLYVVDQEYENALKHLNAMEEALDRLIAATSPEKKPSWNNRSLELQLSYVRIYLMIAEADAARKHLEEARKYYSASTYIDYACKYHELWSNYYALVHQWDECLREMDWVLEARVGREQPIRWLALLGKKVQYLYDADRKAEAIDTFYRLVVESDSINNELLARQEEVLEENRSIQQALLRKERLQTELRLVYIVAALVAFCCLLVMMWRTWRIFRGIKYARKETRDAMIAVQKEDKMKEAFLRNMTERINRPLAEVVRYSQLLSTEKNLTSEVLEEYSAHIRESACSLLVLVNNILDLSRLEAGMMKFVVENQDVVQACRDAVQQSGYVENNHSEVSFHSDAGEVMFSIDYARFRKMLVECFVSQKGDADEWQVQCVFHVEAGCFVITIRNSPLARAVGKSQDAFVSNEINRLFVEAFGGDYRLGEDGSICITFKR